MIGARFEAEIEGETLTMRRGGWSLSCPAQDLDRWLAFYIRLRDRDARKGNGPGPFAAHFEGAVLELQRVAGARDAAGSTRARP